MLCRRGLSRCVQKHKRTLRPTRRAVAEFIYHYHGELNHQGLGNAFVFLDTTGNKRRNHAGIVLADQRLIKFGVRE